MDAPAKAAESAEPAYRRGDGRRAGGGETSRGTDAENSRANRAESGGTNRAENGRANRAENGRANRAESGGANRAGRRRATGGGEGGKSTGHAGGDGGTGGTGGGGGGGGGAAPAKRSGRRTRRLLISIGVIAVLLVAGIGLFFERQSTFDNNIRRIPEAFPNNPDRPSAGTPGAENWLLLGSDKRAQGDPGFGKVSGERADTIILAHLPADRKNAYMVSFPRDSWVTIPGKGRSKINAAYALGGSKLLISTVENLTGVRVDHFGIIDFAGMRSMTDALGGVDVRVDQTVYDPQNKTTWRAGVNHLDGARAVQFVRQRYGLPGGDFDRIKRQQAFLKALAKKSVSRGTLTNPLKLNAFLGALTKSVSVDDSVTIGHLRSRALGFRDLRANDISFMTVPTRGTGSENGQSVVYINAVKAPLLYDALRRDVVADYVRQRGTNNRVDRVN